MNNTGRFDTTTKTKIQTKHGTVLKVSTYEEDCTAPIIEYKTKGICNYCGGDTGCWCFNDDDFDNPLQKAMDCLSTGFICEKPECMIAYVKEDNPDWLDTLMNRYGDDKYAVRDAIQESFGECVDGPGECGV